MGDKGIPLPQERDERVAHEEGEDLTMWEKEEKEEKGGVKEQWWSLVSRV